MALSLIFPDRAPWPQMFPLQPFISSCCHWAIIGNRGALRIIQKQLLEVQLTVTGLFALICCDLLFIHLFFFLSFKGSITFFFSQSSGLQPSLYVWVWHLPKFKVTYAIYFLFWFFESKTNALNFSKLSWPCLNALSCYHVTDWLAIC